ncbi:MAG: glycosyl transferase family 2, partial [Ramlibacter sp.]|nr:glycosyl transferase family 2 [Ramlibacter sp.]
NNDTEVMQPDWLDEMVAQALQAGVGVVGAKLLYPNGLVQHAGDLVGVGGVANHAHAFLRSTDPGYCDRAIVAQEYSAVTGACLLTWRSRYLALGGLDAARLPVAFNDVDYCLRVREAGDRVVWTPQALLVHHESVSRGKDLTRQQLRRARSEAAWMRRRWSHVLGRDPFYNPNLSLERPDFSLSHAPLVEPPWHS